MSNAELNTTFRQDALRGLLETESNIESEAMDEMFLRAEQDYLEQKLEMDYEHV